MKLLRLTKDLLRYEASIPCGSYDTMIPAEKFDYLGVVVDSKDNKTDQSILLNDWVKRSREGDSQAMENIYEHFRSRIFGLAFRYTYNTAVSEDLLQDIFVKVFTHMKNLDHYEAFTGWLYRVAVNTCLSYVRSMGRPSKKTVPLSEVEGFLSENGKNVTDNVMKKPLEEAIKRLSDKLRSVFLLHDVQGFKHWEISTILGCSVGTSKSQLFKARLKIREYLVKNQMI